MDYPKKRYHLPGTSPGTLIEHPDAGYRALRISLIDYSETAIDEQQDIEAAACRHFIERPSVTWVHIQGHPTVGVFEELAELFSLHPLAVEDVANVEHRPKLELYDEQFFITLSLPDAASLSDSSQISLFMGDGYVISFHSGDNDPFERVRKRLRTRNGRIRSRKADYLLYTLIDTIIDQGFPALEYFGEQFEALEIELLNDPDRETLARIHQLRRDLLILRRLLWPQRELINQLIHEEQPLLQEETKLYLRDCYDHCIQIIELLEAYRDMSANLLEIYLSNSSHRLNETMRLLTVIATIFIPLTFVVGLYGMNFGRGANPSPWAMPELDWYYGYPLLWLVMIGLAAGMIAYFKYRRWF